MATLHNKIMADSIQLEADIHEIKRQSSHSMLIIQLESEIIDLKKQMIEIQQQIRQKNTQLSEVMAGSVSPNDIDDILDMPDFYDMQSNKGSAPQAATSNSSLHSDKSDASPLQTPDIDIDNEVSLSINLDLMESKQDIEYMTPMSTPMTPGSSVQSRMSPIAITSISSASSQPTTISGRKRKKKSSARKRKKKKGLSLWQKIEQEIKGGNVDYVLQIIEFNRIAIDDREAKTKRTMLMIAAEYGQYDICGELICAGADVHLTTKRGNGKDAKYFAHKNGHYQVERLFVLSNYGGVKSPSASDVIATLKKHYAV